MSKNNTKNSHIVKAEIINVEKNDTTKSFEFEIKVYSKENKDVIHKNAYDRIDRAYKVGKKLYFSELSFYKSRIASFTPISYLHTFVDVTNPTNVTGESKTIFTINEVDFTDYSRQNNPYFKIKVEWTLSDTSYNTFSFGFLFFQSLNKHIARFTKPGALNPKNNSGILGKAIGKIKKEKSNKFSNLPASSITNGKILQNFKQAFDDTNIIEFSTNSNTNSNLNVPLKNIESNSSEKFYITTNGSLLTNTNPILESDSFFRDKFNIENTDSISLSNTFNLKNNHYESSRKITKNKIDSLIDSNHNSTKEVNIDNNLVKEKFIEEYKPFDESHYHYESKNSEFYTKTIDNDFKDKNYSLGAQKQIKITLDFTEDIDLHLMNTKFSFIKPDRSRSKLNFNISSASNRGEKDLIVSTKFFNFLNETGCSYSSHFLPTAYWNFSNNNWNYLDNTNTLFADDPDTENIDESALYNKLLFGAFNSYLINLEPLANQIYNNFIFTSDGSSYDLGDVNIFYRELYPNTLFNKPILTTPSFRIDGSMTTNNVGENYNKSMLCQITNSYGFPYKSNWQPQNDHLLDMSKYISNDFLLEKVIIKGKFSSKAELPIKKGNFYSGYIKRGSASSVPSRTIFNSSYDYKEGEESQYISNNLTFFILNERKNINYFEKDILIEPVQFYTYLRDSTSNTVEDTISNKFLLVPKLENFLGNFETYEKYSNTLKVKSYSIGLDSIYTLDPYNNIVNNAPVIWQGSGILTNFNKGTFLSLVDKDSINESDSDFIENFYYDNKNEWTDINFNQDLTSGNNFLKYRIKKDYEIIPDSNTSRELVSFSNLLITKKRDSVTLDSEVLKNIDEHIEYSVSDSEELHLNIGNTSPIDFEIKSLCKNQKPSDSYLDESEYKIKSNYYEEVETTPEETSSINFTVSDNKLQTSNFFALNSNKTNADSILGITNLTNSGVIPTSIGSGSIAEELFTFKSHFTKGGNEYTAEFHFTFSYKDPSGLSNYWNYNNETSINLSDFITYSSRDEDPLMSPLNQNKFINIIDLNLRLFNCWQSNSVNLSVFNNLGKISGNLFNFSNLTSSSLSIPVKNGNNINNFSTEYKQNLLCRFIVIAFLLKKVITGTDYYGHRPGSGLLESSSNNFSTSYSEFMNDIGNNDVEIIDNRALFSFLRSKFNPYSFITSNVSLVDFNLNSNSQYVSPFYNFSFLNNVRGNLAIFSDEDYYNLSYVLEGRNKGEPNGLGLKSERIINSRLINQNKIPISKTKSGKYINDGENFNSTINSTYLLKPEDRLVFGATSYCNGQVMPTVFKLHDKVEITLIGRDYIDDKKQKSNLSSGISKIVVGDNLLEKSSTNLNQTKGTYYDNVWNKNSDLNNSLSLFKENKEVVSSSSNNKTSKQITDFYTFTDQKIEDKSIFKKDSLNLSIANVFKNVFNKDLSDSQLENNTLKTNLNLLRFKPEFSESSPENRFYKSYKIIVTEDNTVTDIDNLGTTIGTNFVIDDWHKKYHLKEYSYFSNDNNILENDISLNYVNRPDHGLDIHFDIGSYTARIDDYLYDAIYFLSKDYVTFDGTFTQSNDPVKSYYKSIENYILPASTLVNFQYPVEIQNMDNFQTRNLETGASEDKSFIKSDSNITPKNNNNNLLINNASLQYFSSNTHLPEYLSDFEDYSRHYRGVGFGDLYFNRFSPMWHIVLEISTEEFDLLKSNIENAQKIIENSYLDLFLFEADDLDTPHLKTFKVIKIDETNDYVQLASPLHFWETLEVDDNFIKSSNNKYARIQTNSNIYTASNRPLASDPIWYASLSSTEKQIKKTSKIYNPFVVSSLYNSYSLYTTGPENFVLPLEISSSSLISSLPYTKSALLALKGGSQTDLPDAMIDSLIFNTNFYISACDFKTQNNNISPVYSLEDSITEKFNNNFKLKESSLFFTNRLYLENNVSLIKNRKNNRLEKNENLNNHFINEKIYKSPVYKKIENYFVKTSFDLIYKVKNIKANFDSGFEFDKFSLIEIIEFTNNNTIFEKEQFTLNQPNYSLTSNDVIRVYEDSIYKNYFIDKKEDVPYFEIDLSKNSRDITRELSGSTTVSEPIKIIPQTYNAIPESISEQPLSGIFSTNLGTPIFEIKKQPSGYSSVTSQENKIKSFFYGFSRRSKYRYPLFNLDGFKYGVENSIANTSNFYYSNNSYGMFKDKIMGSQNYCTVYRGKNNINVTNQTVEKKFVDSYFKYIDMEAENIPTTTTFNKDKYARSTYPFIENSQDQLSGYYVS